MNCISEVENKGLGLKIFVVFDKNMLIRTQLNFRGILYIRLREFENKVFHWRKFKY